VTAVSTFAGWLRRRLTRNHPNLVGLP
jgi:hypothetical protein